MNWNGFLHPGNNLFLDPIFDALEQAKFPPTRLYEILKGFYIKPNHEMY